MKGKTVVAVILIALGIAAFAYQSALYATRGAEVGFDTPSTATGRWRSIPLTPVVGANALIGGIALLLVDEPDVKRAATP